MTLFISGCLNRITQQSEFPSDLGTCNFDADCIIVKARGCCECDTVINKKYQDWWNTRNIDLCPGRKCEMCPPKPIDTKCENGRCIYTNNEPSAI